MRVNLKSQVQLSDAVERTEDKIHNQEFLDLARQRPEDFTRNRKMPFPRLVLFMLNMLKASIQTCLDRFFELIGQEDVHMTEQSFSEARQKIRWEAFHELFKTIVDYVYECHYETWHGYRVSAIDGTKIQLPDEQKLRECFGTAGQGNSAATAQASALYDVYNNMLVDAQIAPMSTGERKLALRHIDALCNLASFDKECVVFDRGYASYDLIETLKNCKISFLMRVKKGFNKSIDQLEEGDHSNIVLRKEGNVDIYLRVLKFTLSSGEEETLITDIADKRMGIKAFKALYFKRWPIETKYDEIKNKLEVENFSGRTENAIMQDFYITMYLSNMLAIACWDAQDDLDNEINSKDNKYRYHVNANHAIGTLKDRLILAILEPNPLSRRIKVHRILMLIGKHPVPTRPDRSLPRNPSPRKAKFRHNRKSNC
jgi:hypothetical protein